LYKETFMTSVSYSELRQNLAKYMDHAVNSREEIVVTRQGAGSVVMMSAADYESIMETLYLLSSPANAKALMESIAQLERGDVAEHDLIR